MTEGKYAFGLRWRQRNPAKLSADGVSGDLRTLQSIEFKEARGANQYATRMPGIPISGSERGMQKGDGKNPTA